MSAPELVILWRITEHCDLGCHFCGYSRRLRRPRVSADPEQVAAFGALLKECAAISQREILISWLGGEPLLWPPLFDISRVFKHEFNLQIGVTSNGTVLRSETVRRRIVKDFDQLTISLDGPGAFHDQCRDAPGLYEQLQANITNLRELKARLGHGPRLRINTILMRDNIYTFEELCRTAAEWGVEELTFNALGGQDRPEFYPGHCLRSEEVEWFRQALPGIREQMARCGLTIYGSDRYLNRIASSAQGLSIPVYECGPGQTFLFIDERGYVAPCSFTVEGYGIHLSEIRTPHELLQQLPEQFGECKRDKMLSPCYDCLSTQVFGKFSSA